MLQRSTWSNLLLSAAVVATSAGSAVTWAQEEAPAAPAAAAAPSQENKSFADDFLHYSLVSNTELAKANAEALLKATVKPEDVLFAFEAAENGRNPREIMIRNAKREELREVSKQLLDKLEEGFRVVSRNPERIRAEVDRLGSGPRGYANAKARLINAGPFAAPVFIEYLQDEKKKSLQPYVLRVMGEIGRPLLPPLLEQLKMSEQGDKIALINVVGQIGYPQALPTLRHIVSDEKTPEGVKAAAEKAIAGIDRTGASPKAAADLFLASAQAYFAQKPSYQAPFPDQPTNPIWQYDKALNNVQAIPASTAIWHNIMAMRAAEQVIKLQPTNSQAITVWIAANLRRELQLPAGGVDPLKVEGKPDASFYARAAGPIYLNPILTTALTDHDAALALKVIDALEATGGTSGSVLAMQGAPLVKALSYPDRAVRFKAAFALAKANPAKEFTAHFRVVPILAEAIIGTGAPNALVVMADENTRNKMAATLRDSTNHYTVYTGSSLATALETARQAPAFDVVVIANGPEVIRVGQLGVTDYRLAGAPVLVTGEEESLPSIKVALAEAKGYAPLSQNADEAAITAALTAARNDVAVTPLDPEKANVFAATAVSLLNTLAGDRASIYKVDDALATLIEGLKDKRTDISTGVAGVLGKLNNIAAQKALATAALAPDVDPTLRAALLNALAESAKHTGNALDAASINALIKLVSSDGDVNVRTASATALGALNIPSNQASILISGQAK